MTWLKTMLSICDKTCSDTSRSARKRASRLGKRELRFEHLEAKSLLSTTPLLHDADTSLLLRFDDNAVGTSGELPTAQVGTSYASGLVNQAVNIGSSGYLRYDLANNLESQAGTVEFWIRPNWDGDSNTTRVFFEAGDNFNNGMLLSIDGANNLRLIQWGDDQRTPGETEINVERGISASGAQWQQGEWHHVAATWDSEKGNYALYIDGLQIDRKIDGVQIGAFSSSYLSVGADINGASPANASFDEVRVSTRVRTPEEIAAAYEAGLGIDLIPNGQRAVARNNAVRIDWAEANDPAGDFDHYAIYRSTAPFRSVAGMSPLWTINDISTNRFHDNTAVNGEHYYYAITSIFSSQPEFTDVTPIGPRTPYDESDLQVVSIARSHQFPRYRPEYADYEVTEPGGFGPYVFKRSIGLENGQSFDDPRFPDLGEMVTYTATVRNRGTNYYSGNLSATWHVDGTVSATPLQAISLHMDETTTFELVLPWDFNSHELTFTIHLADAIVGNNTLTSDTLAVPFLSYVNRSYVEEFREVQVTPYKPVYDWVEGENNQQRAQSGGALSHDGSTYYFQTESEQGDGRLYAINTSDGSVKWSYWTQSKGGVLDSASSPIVTTNGVIVVGNNLGNTYFAIQDMGSYGQLLDTLVVDAAGTAQASATISTDGMLYLPLRIVNDVGIDATNQVENLFTAIDLGGVPSSSPAIWAGQHRDIWNTGRADFVVPDSRLNDTFFDTFAWQTRVPESPVNGRLSSTSMVFYDGVGPGEADVVAGTYHWPKGLQLMDRHTGEVFWFGNPGGGEEIGNISPAFSNDGSVIYVTNQFTPHPLMAIPTAGSGPETSWHNGDDPEPALISATSPKVAPDGRIFVSGPHDRPYGATDLGDELTTTWYAETESKTWYTDPAMYEGPGGLRIVQAGADTAQRAPHRFFVKAYDGGSGKELWNVWTGTATAADVTIDPASGHIYIPHGVNDVGIVGVDQNGNRLWEPISQERDIVDWLNAHMERFNEMLAEAGTQKRVHFDVLEVLDDIEPLPTIDQSPYAIFPSNPIRYGDFQFKMLSAGYIQGDDIDYALLHEWAHQLGLIDFYQFHIDIPDMNLVSGETYFVDTNLMSAFRSPVSEFSALAMEEWLREAHGYYGQFLYDLPSNMQLRITGPYGNALEGATVKVYQRVWRDDFQGIPNEIKFQGTTDADGLFTLPNVPIDPQLVPAVATGNELNDNPFGYVDMIGRNGLFMIRVEKNGVHEDVWLDITEANVAYWKGQTDLAVFDRQVSFDGLLLPGDFDQDGDVDHEDLQDPNQGWEARYGERLTGLDFLAWQRNFGESSEHNSQATFENDVIVTSVDFSICCESFSPILEPVTTEDLQDLGVRPLAHSSSQSSSPTTEWNGIELAEEGTSSDRYERLESNEADNRTSTESSPSWNYNSSPKTSDQSIVLESTPGNFDRKDSANRANKRLVKEITEIGRPAKSSTYQQVLVPSSIYGMPVLAGLASPISSGRPFAAEWFKPHVITSTDENEATTKSGFIQLAGHRSREVQPEQIVPAKEDHTSINLRLPKAGSPMYSSSREWLQKTDASTIDSVFDDWAFGE